MILNGKPINPGEMRTEITLKARSVSVETGGFQTPSYGTGTTVWARWKNAHGSEVWTAEAAGANAPATVLIRYLASLDETYVVEKGGELFEIVSMDNIEERNEYIELKVRALRNG